MAVATPRRQSRSERCQSRRRRLGFPQVRRGPAADRRLLPDDEPNLSGSIGLPDVRMPARGHALGAPVSADDLALLHVFEAYIETLKAENEILKRRLADADARAARETAKAEWAIAEFSALTRRLTAHAADRASRG